MPADLHKARDLFMHAVGKLPPEQWESYIAANCAGDVDLERHVRRMFQVHAEAGSFLEKPANFLAATGDFDSRSPIVQTFRPGESPGSMIGPYKLLEQIGEGGMGTVWMAQQNEPIKRLVAIKLIKPGMDSKQVLARFDAERQTLALMDHPNIAKVFDAGTVCSEDRGQKTADRGQQSSHLATLHHAPPTRPFFVMELVKGVPITKYCDEHHLSPRQRLELFVQVCQAIQHAHQKGIIHRDVKPSNVLVALYDNRPVPKVIDFGVAKATGVQLTESTLHTNFGTVVGTLEYMSPEQASFNQLDVDTRSDIYSLGVLLYELLAGSPPFTNKELEKAGVLEMLRMIREQEPSKPSTKLSSSDALPSLSASRGTEPGRLTKLVRGELDWIVMKALEKDRSRRYETANGFAMDVQRYLADEPVQACPPSMRYRMGKFARRNKVALTVASLVLFFIVVIGTGLGWTLRDREARKQDSARKLAETKDEIRGAIDRASKTQGTLHATLEKPGGVQDLLNQPARWELMITTAQQEVAHARTLAAGEQAVGSDLIHVLDRLEQQLLKDEADFALARRIEAVHLDMATPITEFELRRTAQKYRDAFAHLGIMSKPPDHAAAQIADSSIREQLVAGLDHWAVIAFALKETELVEQLLAVARKALPDATTGNRLRQLELWRNKQALERIVADTPPSEFSPQLLYLIGQLLPIEGAQRLSWLRRAQEQRPADFWLNLSLALALGETNPVEATGFYRAALAIRPTSSSIYSDLGIAFRLQKKLPQAVASCLKAIELDATNAAAYTNLAAAYSYQGKLTESIAACEKAIELAPELPQPYINLGNALHKQEKLAEAVIAYQKAIAIDSGSFLGYDNLGNTLREQRKLPEAIDAHRKAIEINPKYALAYYNLGLAFLDQRKLPDAIDAFRKSIELDPTSAKTFNNFGKALADQRNYDAAVVAYRKAIELDPGFDVAFSNLGSAYSNLQRLTEAVDALRKAIELKPDFAEAYYNLGNVYFSQQRYPEALNAFRKAVEIRPKFGEAHNGVGAVLRSQQKFPEAITAFREAIKLNPANVVAHYNLGLCLDALQKVPEAVEAYRKSVELNPQFEQGYYTLGLALADQRKFVEAIDAFRKVIQLNPNNAPAHLRLGVIFGLQQQLPEAIDALRKSIELDPKNARAYSNLGTALYRQRKFSESADALKKAIEIEPRSAEHHHLLGLVLREQGDARAALVAFLKANELNPIAANGPSNAHLYNAIRTAALAGIGKGPDADKLAPVEQVYMRRRALEWLRADLDIKGKLLSQSPATAEPIHNSLQIWLTDPDLNGVREVKELSGFSPEEREDWMKLWSDVRNLKERTERK